MPRYVVSIDSYTISFTNTKEKLLTDGQTTRRRVYDIDDPDHGLPWERKLILKTSGPWGNDVTRIELRFLRGILSGSQSSSLASYSYYSDRLNTLYFSLDISDFKDCYSILQTEKPLTIMWEIDTNPNNPISWRLSTSTDEPLGENDED